MIKNFGASISIKRHFLPKEMPHIWPKTAFFGHEWSVAGPHTHFGGCWTQKKVFCKVLEQLLKCFGVAITKNCILLHENKHVWFELYKSCYSQLGGECHISRMRPILDGIKPPLSI